MNGRRVMDPSDPVEGHEWRCSVCGEHDDETALVIRAGVPVHPACETESDAVDRMNPGTTRAREDNR